MMPKRCPMWICLALLLSGCYEPLSVFMENDPDVISHCLEGSMGRDYRCQLQLQLISSDLQRVAGQGISLCIKRPAVIPASETPKLKVSLLNAQRELPFDTVVPAGMGDCKGPDGMPVQDFSQYMVATLNDSRKALCGLNSVNLRVGSVVLSAADVVRVYTPPAWTAAAPANLAPAVVKAVQIVKPMGSTAGAIFVTAEDPSGPTVRFAQRYDLAAGILTPNIGNDFRNRTVRIDTSMQFAVTPKSVLAFYFDGGVFKRQVRAFGYAPGQSSDDGTIDVQSTPALFAASPDTGLRFLYTETKSQVFNFDFGRTHVPGTLLTPPTQKLMLTALRRWPGGEGVGALDGVAVTTGNAVLFWAYNESSGELSLANSSMLQPPTLQAQPQAVALDGLDCDTSFAVITAYSGAMARLEWYPYLGNGKFGALRTVRLPQAQASFVDLAVGDLDMDGHPDIAVAMPNAVFALQNTAPWLSP